MESTSEVKTAGGVQSVHRALDVLEAVAAHGGSVSVVELAAAIHLPAPTTHRLVRTLMDRGYMRQMADRRYALGYRLVPLGEAANSLLGVDAHDILAGLVAELGETANLAILVGDQAEYVAQVPANYSMRMFTEVGRRVDLHDTGVGKALLSQLASARIKGIISRRGLPGRTPYTVTTEPDLMAELERVRERGYALDEQEQELGVRCVAVAVSSNAGAGMAVSVSGPLTRMSDDVIARAVPLLQRAAEELAHVVAANPD